MYALIAAHLATLVLNWKDDLVILRGRLRKNKQTKAKEHGNSVRYQFYIFSKKEKKRCKNVFFRWARLLIVLLYGIVDFVFSIIRRYAQDDQTNVSYVAHIFGALSGLLVGIVVLKNRKVEHWERKLKIACVITFVSILLVFILFNVTASVWKDEFFHKPDPALENCQLRL